MDICVVSSFSDLISDFLKFKNFCLPSLFQNPLPTATANCNAMVCGADCPTNSVVLEYLLQFDRLL